MLNRLPANKDDIITLYNTKNNNTSVITQLEPVICAQIRDKAQQQFSEFLEKPTNKKITIANQSIEWIDPVYTDGLLNAVGLENDALIKPCQKRIKFIEIALQYLTSLFKNELDFIVAFTSSICWLQPNEGHWLGSAGFYEAPHCTFFSDLAMFSLPPEIIVPKKYAGYAILENLYHEALHHQMHAFSSLTQSDYLQIDSSNMPLIQLDWRDRSFTLLEALHALHVYAMVTPMRLTYYQTLFQQMVNDLDWILKAYQEGLRMWKDLSAILLTYLNDFKSPWTELIIHWHHLLEKNNGCSTALCGT